MSSKNPTAQKSFFPKKLHKQSGDFVNRKLESTIKNSKKKICGPDGRHDTHKKSKYLPQKWRKNNVTAKEKKKKKEDKSSMTHKTTTLQTLLLFTHKKTPESSKLPLFSNFYRLTDTFLNCRFLFKQQVALLSKFILKINYKFFLYLFQRWRLLRNFSNFSFNLFNLILFILFL